MRIYNIINIPKGLSPEFECDCQDEYNSGYTQGVEDQKSKLSSLSVTGNGEYVSEDGFSAVTVDVPQEDIHLEPLGAVFSANGNYDIRVHSGYDGFRSPANIYVEVPQTGHTDEEMEEAFESGVTSGITEQKSRLSGVTITENGTYTRADGFSAVNVDVPQEEVRLENLFAVLSANGTYDFTARSGYGGFQSPAGAYVNVPQTGHTDEEMEDSWNSGYTSGVTDGYASGYTSGKTDGFDAGYDSGVTDGYTSGKTDAWQPAYDSGYTDGAASVDCQPLYDSGYTDGYSSGRTDGYDDGWRPGYNSGYTDGINAAGGDYASGYTDGFDAGYDSGSTDGYASGYASGRTDGYDDGWQPGYDSGMTDGYNSGYTSGKTDGFGEGYDSGYTDGAASVDCQPLYDSGYTDGYESGHTDGYDERAAMLTAMTITANGAYESVEGWSAVTVNVSGYSQEDLDNAYTSGHTSGVTDGVAQQKALLTSTTFTTNGTYTRTDGWSSVTVNVPQTGYTQQDLDNAYASGLTNGYDSGWTAGYDSGYTDGLDACSGVTPATGTTVLHNIYRTDDLNPDFLPSSATVLFQQDVLSAVAEMWIDGSAVTPSYVADFSGDAGRGGVRYHDVEIHFEGNTVPRGTFSANTGTHEGAVHLIHSTVSGDCTEIGDVAYWLCNIGTDYSRYPGLTMSDNIVLNSSGHQFGYTQLREVDIPTATTKIPWACFYCCYNLKRVGIHSGVTEIGNQAFQQVYALSSITIPASVEKIGFEAFETCTGLTSVIMEGATPPVLEYTSGSSSARPVFNNTTCTFYVPANAVETYKAATGWSVYANRIQAIQ